MEIRSVGYYCPTFKTETKSALDLAPWLPVSSRLVLVGHYQLYNEFIFARGRYQMVYRYDSIFRVP